MAIYQNNIIIYYKINKYVKYFLQILLRIRRIFCFFFHDLNNFTNHFFFALMYKCAMLLFLSFNFLIVERDAILQYIYFFPFFISLLYVAMSLSFHVFNKDKYLKRSKRGKKRRTYKRKNTWKYIPEGIYYIPFRIKLFIFSYLLYILTTHLLLVDYIDNFVVFKVKKYFERFPSLNSLNLL